MGKAGAPKGHPPYPGCETGGRPIKWTQERIEEEAEEFLKFLDKPGVLWFEEFCVERGYDDSYLRTFAQKNERFNEVLLFAKTWQKVKLIKGGLLKKLSAPITSRLLGAVYGIRDEVASISSNHQSIYVMHYGKGNPKTWNEEQNPKGKA